MKRKAMFCRDASRDMYEEYYTNQIGNGMLVFAEGRHQRGYGSVLEKLFRHNIVHMPGEHWIAIYVDDDGHYGKQFDSFGRAHSGVFERYMKEHCPNGLLIVNSYRVRLVAFVVIIALVFCILRSSGVDTIIVISNVDSYTVV